MRTVHQEVESQFAADLLAGSPVRKIYMVSAVVAMGKLGGREDGGGIRSRSRFSIYDFDSDKPDSDGERSLQGSQ